MKKIFQVLMMMLLLPLLPLESFSAAAAVTVNFRADDPHEISLLVGQSQFINTALPVEQTVIGNPDVADTKLLTTQRILLLGIKPGSTNLTLRPKGNGDLTVINVTVSYDRNGIKRKISETMPNEPGIEVRDSNDKVILTGQASSAASMEMALAVARSFVPNDSVVNLLQIGGGQQVMLEARISEVSRNSLKDLGIQTQISSKNGKLQIITGQALASIFGVASYTGNGSPSVALAIEALEKKGLAKILAEPNLVALSGQEANFLAGGEIPIPVAQSGGVGTNGTITITYKEFGVGLRFTPTVLDRDRINLKLLSEVSAIDPTNSFNVGNGISVPALSTRRAGTSVEMGDGQSFAIAGLMQSNMKNAIQQLPGLGSLPVLGALFRSTDFQNDESELVIIMTVHLVKPVKQRDMLAAPTDIFVPPSDFDQYLLGRLEGTPRERRSSQGQVQAPGGIDGSFGHQINSEKKDAH